ncbi:hypothetical protein CAC42_706 [Sphaceloma murrayae]|uniref:Spindle pole body-associated protein cut12 domain-containing protein n=1 Tax=Sphaceloma murrayae TaxID=2082308 RepID=A0A2K1QJZ6_9PEZI|nr:hypothetical protein CAC42_706 [Sphaceloma murrayae]
MLSWLSGPSRPVQQEDDATFCDQPDTPAHVFAARAFKYRLWGTPRPQDTSIKPRDRPSSYYGNTSAQQNGLSASPSKPNGILMTPGTANLKRSKTVTFGAQKAEPKREQIANRTKSAPVVPGKFPTPSRLDMTAMDVPVQPQPTSEFTDRLRKAQTTDNSNEVRVEIKRKPEVENEKVTETLSNPLIDWKDRYEQYTARTEREMKRLIAKQQAAKHFAREKDTAATALAEDLREERKKISLLESQISNLNTEVVRMQKDLLVATRRAAIDPSRSINDYEKPSKASPARPSTHSKPAPPIPSRSSARRPPPPTTENDIWASSFLSPTADRKPKFTDDFVSSHLRRTRLTPRHPPTGNPSQSHPMKSSPLRTRDVNKGSTTPVHTPPNSKRRSVLYSPSTRRRSAHVTPVRPSPRRSRASLLIDEQDPAEVFAPKTSGEDESLALPVPSPEAAVKTTGTGRGLRPVRPVRPVDAVESSPFLVTPEKYDRLALRPYSVPSPDRDEGEDRRDSGAGGDRDGTKGSMTMTRQPSTTRRAERDDRGDGRRAQENENRNPIVMGWKDVVGVQETPRRVLDAERRAKAAARIAARRREREVQASRGMI